MKLPIALPAAFILAILLMGAEAETSPSPTLPDVTVTAPRPPTPQELAANAVPDFVHAHAAPALAAGQLARWHVDVCPLTSGLSPEFNDFVSDRILAFAASVGAPHELRGGCRHDGKHDDRADLELVLPLERGNIGDDMSRQFRASDRAIGAKNGIEEAP